MAWVRLDDQLFHNAKARSVGPHGRELFLASVCYAAMQLNDGCFVAEDVQVIAALAQVDPSVGDLLITKGLWHPANDDCAKCRSVGQTMPVPSGHLSVHEYLRDNPSRAKVVADREKDRQRKRSARDSGRSPPGNPAVPSRPVPTGDLSTRRRGDSRGDAETRPDDDEVVDNSVPDVVWDHYADLKLAGETAVRNPGPWKAACRRNARTELGEQAERWWATFAVDPRRLAQALVDGQAPRNVARREGP